MAFIFDLLAAELMLIRAEDTLRVNAWRLHIAKDTPTWDAIEILRTARCEAIQSQLVEERKS